MIVRLFRQWGGAKQNVFLESSFSFELLAIVTLAAGAIFLMWLGEQISEYGIGNGISLLIMAGIIARMPHQIRVVLHESHGQGGTDIKKLLFLLVLFVIVIVAVIYMTYGQRKVTVQQAKHTKGRRVYGGQKHSLPLKVNQAGVMPVIFGSSLMAFPMTIGSMIAGTRTMEDAWFSWGSFWYVFIYILLIYFFSYFWTSLMFQPTEMANQLKEYGSFIPGIRPGPKTAEYLEKVMVHITFVGAAFLALIALMPEIVILGMDIQDRALGGFISNMGGTSILIVVGVILDVVQKLESHLLMRHYEGFIKKGRIRGRR
jgi:preprotein translocase subunit SecY